MKNKKSKKMVVGSNRMKELVKPENIDTTLIEEAEFLCVEHNAGCRRNSSVVDDDDILF